MFRQLISARLGRFWLPLMVFCLIFLVSMCFLPISARTSSPAQEIPTPKSPDAPQAPSAASAVVSWEWDQIQPALAYSSGANVFLSVWEDHHWGFGADWDIYARLMNGSGAPYGGIIGVAYDDSNHRLNPTVASNSSSEFLVVWQYAFSSSDHDIYARRVDTSGIMLTSELSISTYTNYESSPAVAFDTSNHRYLLVWERGVGSDEFVQRDIYAQLLNEDGSLYGSQFAITTSGYNDAYPAVAYSPSDGSFLVVWQGRNAWTNYDIYGQRVSSSGSLVGGLISISTPLADNDQIKPRLAYDGYNYRYLVVWEDHFAGASNWDINGQLVNAAGSLYSGNFTIASSYSNNCLNPDVSYNPASGEFQVAYEYEYNTSDHDVYWRRVSYMGTVPDLEMVLSNSISWEGNPAIASGGSTNAAVIWEDGRNSSTMALDIYADVAPMYAFSGKVYSGALGDESTPIGYVEVDLHCSTDLNSYGPLIAQSSTFAHTGHYFLVTSHTCEYYNLVESDPSGYLSVGATSPGGTVRDPNWIQYTWPLAGKNLGDNKFWDSLPPASTSTSTATQTSTSTSTKTATTTATRTSTSTATKTGTATGTATSTSTRTKTLTPTSTSTVVAGNTATATQTATRTATSTLTPTPSETIVITTTVEPPIPLADLVINDLWLEGSTICYQVRNTGQAEAPEGHLSYLSVDDLHQATSSVGAILQPGQRWNGCFAYTWACTTPQDSLRVEADQTDLINEGDESNNNRMENWACDTTPPEIISGPYVTDLTKNSARINWQTNEASDSRVDYGKLARAYSSLESDGALLTSHSLVLSGLTASSTYHYRVQSRDTSGNAAVSEEQVFRTQDFPDGVLPVIQLEAGTVFTSTVTISSTASDNRGVDRVIFKWDGQQIFTDYSPPYHFELDTSSLSNGEHLLSAVAVDLVGNTKETQKSIDVANIQDSSLPTVNITNPTADQTVGGTIQVKATLGDDTGLTYAYFYVDGSPTAFEPMAGNPKTYNLSIDWDSKTTSDGNHRLGLMVYDKEGKGTTATVDIIVSNPAPPPPPKLIITSHSAARVLNWFLVSMTVKNVGGSTAKEIVIDESLQYFQPVSHEGVTPGALKYTARYVPSANWWDMLIEDQDDLAVGATRTYSYLVIPVLETPPPPTPSIGTTISFYYEGPDNKSYNPKVSLPIVTDASGDVLLKAYYRAIGEADLLIVTNPLRLQYLYGTYPYTNTNLILSRMSELAVMRNGALAFMTDSDLVNRINLRMLLNPQGLSWGVLGDSWAQRLNPNFSNPLGGSLLIVGETEIFGAWYDSTLNGNFGFKGVHLSDHPFADVNLTDPRPDLVVGRLIGDSADVLLKELDTAVGVAYNRTGFSFKRDDALLFSDEGWGSFVNDIQNINTIINSDFSVDISHWKDNSVVADFGRSIQGEDALAAGDVVGTAWDEIVLADASEDKVYFYNKDGAQQGSFTRGFDTGDRLAVGDVLGDARPEILVGDASSGQVLIYNSTGSLQCSFSALFGSGDNLAVGNLLNQTKSQVLVAKALPGLNPIFVYRVVENTPGNYSAVFDQLIPSQFNWYDGFAAGDITDGGEDEFVIASSVADKLLVYRPAISAWSTYTATLQSGQNIAIGSFAGNHPKEAIALVEPKTRILTFWMNGSNWSHSDIPCALYGLHACKLDYKDGIAVGNVGLFNGALQSEVILASQYGRILSFDHGQWEGRTEQAFPGLVSGQDLLVYSGHGGETGWGQRGGISTYDTGMFPLTFNAHNPFVLSLACLTGDYQQCMCGGPADVDKDNHCPCTNATDEYNNIAEKMMESGAGVFIGSTEVSDGMPNREMGKKLFNTWTPNKSIAQAFTEIERSVWSGNTKDKWWFWVWEYNLYGDPKYGAVPASGAPASSGTIPEIFQSPQAISSTLQVDIPNYVVSQDVYPPGLDLAEIPGGQMWLGAGEPRIPFYNVTYDYPVDQRVQQVQLVGRSEAQTAAGLDLPANPLTSLPSNDSPEAATPSDGWFPTAEYSWETLYNPDGSQTLMLSIYPFYYNAQTSEVRFYNQYTFDVATVTSPVSVTAMKTDQPVYPMGTPVTVEMEIENPAAAMDIIASAVIRRYGNQEIQANLLLQTLENFSGKASFDLNWDTQGAPAGSYQVEVNLADMQGNILDRAVQAFEVGAMFGELHDLEVSSSWFQPGVTLVLSVQVHNPSSVPLNADLQIQAYNSLDQIVASFTTPVVGLAAGGNLDIETVWDTSGIPNDDYKIAAFLSYESSASEPVYAWATNYQRVYLPVLMR